MDGQIPEQVKRERAERLEQVGAEIRRDLLSRYAAEHRETPVHLLVEKNGGGFLSGHSEHFVELKKIPGRAEVGEVVPVLLDSTDGIRCGGKLAGN